MFHQNYTSHFSSLLLQRTERYTYGFQGQESEKEITGSESHYSFEYRITDTRIGRFFSPDPLESSYPHNSPYVFSENRVIDAIEFEGLESITQRSLHMARQIYAYHYKEAKSNQIKAQAKQKFMQTLETKLTPSKVFRYREGGGSLSASEGIGVEASVTNNYIETSRFSGVVENGKTISMGRTYSINSSIPIAEGGPSFKVGFMGRSLSGSIEVTSIVNNSVYETMSQVTEDFNVSTEGAVFFGPSYSNTNYYDNSGNIIANSSASGVVAGLVFGAGSSSDFASIDLYRDPPSGAISRTFQDLNTAIENVNYGGRFVETLQRHFGDNWKEGLFKFTIDNNKIGRRGKGPRIESPDF